MKKRNPIAVFALSFITIFFYSWYWQVKTKGEMNKLGEKIPTAWIWLIPVVGSIWWTWKYSEAVEHVTKKELSGVLAFIVIWLLGPIGNAIVQDYFNKIESAAVLAAGNAPAVAPAAPATVAPAAPQPVASPAPIPSAEPEQNQNPLQQQPPAPTQPTPPAA